LLQVGINPGFVGCLFDNIEKITGADIAAFLKVNLFQKPFDPGSQVNTLDSLHMAHIFRRRIDILLNNRGHRYQWRRSASRANGRSVHINRRYQHQEDIQ